MYLDPVFSLARLHSKCMREYVSPLAQFFFFDMEKGESKSFDVATGPAQTIPSHTCHDLGRTLLS